MPPRKSEDTPTVALPAIGVSLTESLGDQRQIVLQTHFAQDATDDEAHALVDRMFEIADRQKARYDLEAHEEGFATVGLTLSNLIDGLPHAERNFIVAQEGLHKELEKQRALSSAEADLGYEEHVKAGKRGEYKPVGARKNQIEGYARQIARITVDLEKNEMERAAHRQELAKSIAHYQADLKKRRAKIDQLRAMTGQESIEDWLFEELFEVPAE